MAAFGYQVKDYDDRGCLKAPVWTWPVLLLTGNAWWLIALDSALAGKGSVMVETLYPPTWWLVGGLAAGVPAWLSLFVYPWRHAWGRVMKWSYLLAVTATLLMEGRMVWQLAGAVGRDDMLLWVSLVMVGAGCLLQLYPDRRNRDVFMRIN
ncbi:DUF2919 family protein [Escherichia coli]|uniref:DUF2919 family protein n=1 Tax=Escherichia coli TaxID=562 RepID=UPI00148275BD|nr:DUF2919 family protein [Escherichia coli]NNR30496.1 DUF2919 family protein [Escherichia coli]